MNRADKAGTTNELCKSTRLGVMITLKMENADQKKDATAW